MILSVHAIFGAAAASLVPTHPVGAFAVGFASHFLLDVIPHRDYDLISLQSDSVKGGKIINLIINKFKLIRDVVFVSLDILVGVCLAFVMFFNPLYPLIFLLGAFGGMLPDFFIFLSFFNKSSIINLYYKIHSGYIHSNRILNLNEPAGIFLQYITVMLLLAFIFAVRVLLQIFIPV